MLKAKQCKIGGEGEAVPALRVQIAVTRLVEFAEVMLGRRNDGMYLTVSALTDIESADQKLLYIVGSGVRIGAGIGSLDRFGLAEPRAAAEDGGARQIASRERYTQNKTNLIFHT
jgi:hypothetical protein